MCGDIAAVQKISIRQRLLRRFLRACVCMCVRNPQNWPRRTYLLRGGDRHQTQRNETKRNVCVCVCDLRPRARARIRIQMRVEERGTSERGTRNPPWNPHAIPRACFLFVYCIFDLYMCIKYMIKYVLVRDAHQ